jgi:hypothetical protein
MVGWFKNREKVVDVSASVRSFFFSSVVSLLSFLNLLGHFFFLYRAGRTGGHVSRILPVLLSNHSHLS